MTSVLTHRGPDQSGAWFDAWTALGHRRLSIIDLDSGRQPLANETGSVQVVFNGEIYNYRELRDGLQGRGHRFATQSDTEVIVHLYEEYGDDCLDHLRGMFALAVWDVSRRRVLLARDRMGQKPLVYRNEPDRLLFASELKALLQVPGAPRELDPISLDEFLTYQYVPHPRTMLAGYCKLPPAHKAVYQDGQLTVQRYWRPGYEEPIRDRSREDWQEALRETLTEAVRLRLRSDVPLGAFLSGGIDSTIIAGLMQEQSNTPIHTFSIGFPVKQFDEREHARVAAKHLGTTHHESVVDPSALENLPRLAWHYDEPFADSSAVPTFLLARETRRHVTVALSGDGADEVFGGYRKYQGELMAARYRTLPLLLRRGLIEPFIALLPESKSSPLLERARHLRRFTRHAGKDAVGRQAGWMRLMDEREFARLFAQPAEAPGLEGMVAELRRDAGDDDALNAMLYADSRLGLPGDMLVKSDRMSMANSLEVRCPFLDHRVVECAEAMPGAFKLAPGAGKKILRRAFADRLPREVFELPKKGFEIPIAEWLTGPLDDLTRRAIDEARLRRQGIFRPEQPRHWYEDLKSGRRDSSEKLWTLIAFQAWCENFRPDLAA